MINYFEIILILVIFVLAFWVHKLYQDKKQGDREAEALAREKDEYAEMGRGLAEYNKKLQEKREQAISKILDMVKAKGKISNREAAETLGISSATARRYFDDLEAEKRIRQVGKDGRSVFYTATAD